MTDRHLADVVLEKLGYRPESCRLSCALSCIVNGRLALSSDDYDWLREELDLEDSCIDEACTSLIIALKNGLLQAEGYLVVFEPPHGRLDIVSTVPVRPYLWEDFLQGLKAEFEQPSSPPFYTVLRKPSVSIPPDLWNPLLYDWNEDLLHTPMLAPTHAAFNRVCVKTQQLARILRDEIDGGTSLTAPRRRGASYKWEDFTAEIVSIANHPDGLPETQADLVDRMASWCLERWGKQPAESMLKAKISAICKQIKPPKP
jgi:hypothetical protein